MDNSAFDYSQLNPKDLEVVQEHTQEIKKRMGKLTPEDVMSIGERLIEVKNRLAHGLFIKWLGAEFEWTRQQTHAYMKVAEREECKKFLHLPVSVSALYKLAAPSVPDEAIAEAIQRAESGETITNAIAKEICQQYKTPKPKPEFNAEQTLERLKKAVDVIEATVPAECKEWFGEYLMLLGKQIIGRAERVD